MSCAVYSKNLCIYESQKDKDLINFWTQQLIQVLIKYIDVNEPMSQCLVDNFSIIDLSNSNEKDMTENYDLGNV